MRGMGIIAACAALVSGVAHADLKPLEKQYVSDRERAIHALTSELRDRCISDFLSKSKEGQAVPAGSLAYNDTVSRKVYNAFYWDQSDRGVAFTAPVAMKNADGERVGNLACFYAVTDQGLRFQLSQRVF